MLAAARSPIRHLTPVLALCVVLAGSSCGDDASRREAGPPRMPGPSPAATDPAPATTSVPVTTTPARPASTSATTPTARPVAPVHTPRTPTVYDNTLATEACQLLSRTELEQAFGKPAGEPMPVDPFCQWSVGTDGWVSLELHKNQPLATFRRRWGAASVADAEVGEGGYFANNKALVFGKGDHSYVLVYQRSGVWDDRARPMQLAAAQSILAHIDQPLAAPPPLTPAPAVDAQRSMTAPEPLRIYVGGDSLAGGPSWAIGDQLDRTGLVRSHREFHVGSGLANREFLDWHRHLQAQVDAYRPEAVILMFGANDGLPLATDGTSVWPDDPRWAAAYRRRVADVLDVTASEGRIVMWIGLPPMQDAKLSASVEKANDIIADEVPRHPGAFFFDTWSRFGAPGNPGTYTDTVADTNGNNTRVRLDGIHLNTDGSRVLAQLVYPELRRYVPHLPQPA